MSLEGSDIGGLEIHAPYMYRGDSQYLQGEYQYIHYFDGSNTLSEERDHIGPSNVTWGSNGIFVNGPSNHHERLYAPEASNGKFYNYGLNYPMTFVYPYTFPQTGGYVYVESYIRTLNNSLGYIEYHPYYLPSNKYPKHNFIPTLLGRDARIYNPLADDAFLNFSSFIRFNLGPPDPSGHYDDTDVSNVYQGNFSQFPYLWNQWTRPINLMGGLFSRYQELQALIDSGSYIDAGYTYDDLLEDFFKAGYFNGKRYKLQKKR